jgi:hypothetical protein
MVSRDIPPPRKIPATAPEAPAVTPAFPPRDFRHEASLVRPEIAVH